MPPLRTPLVPAACFLLAVVPAFVLPACGPSFQAVYEGDARFEHCYALDESPNASLDRKGACWRDWSQRYTYGQTRDRIDYAASRHHALSRVDLPTDEAIMQAAPGEGATRASVTAPAPTSAFAPPPGTMAADAGAPVSRTMALPAVSRTDEEPSVPQARAPGADCGQACNDSWRMCGGRCKGTGCDACERDLRRCMRTCFKDDAPAKKGSQLAPPAASPSASTSTPPSTSTLAPRAKAKPSTAEPSTRSR